jgi:hypothetical protein
MKTAAQAATLSIKKRRPPDMKKLTIGMFFVVLTFALSAFAQDSMGNMSSSSSTSTKTTTTASSKKMGKAVTVKGWVSDAKCGAGNASADKEACAKKCVAGGEKIVFVADKDKKVWNVTNPDALKDHVGHHVSVRGHVDADAGTVHVVSVKMVSKTKAKKAAAAAKAS